MCDLYLAASLATRFWWRETSSYLHGNPDILFYDLKTAAGNF